MAGKTSLVGLDEAMAKLNAMAANVQAKHAKKAARKAMQIALKDARRRARAIDDPDTAAQISKNIVLQVGKTGSKNKIKMRLGVKGGGKFYKTPKNRRKKSGSYVNPHYEPIANDTRHWWLVEFGTAKTPARPFMRPALAQNTTAITTEFGQQLHDDIVGDIK